MVPPPSSQTNINMPNSGTTESNSSNIHWIRTSSSSALELLGAVSQFRHNVERYRWYIHSISTIKFLCVLNVTYTLVGLTFLLLAHFPPTDLVIQQVLFFRIGVCILFFSPLALTADLLALRGLHQYKRVLLLPWLILYAVMLTLAFVVFLSEMYHRGLRWHLLLLGFITMMMFTRWRHINLQFKLMSVYPDKPTEQSINELAGEIRTAASTAQTVSNEDAFKNTPPPPKYEDLEQPPRYEECQEAGLIGACALVEDDDKTKMESELADLKSVVSALEGEERSKCQARIDEIEAKLQTFAN